MRVLGQIIMEYEFEIWELEQVQAKITAPNWQLCLGAWKALGRKEKVIGDETKVQREWMSKTKILASFTH